MKVRLIQFYGGPDDGREVHICYQDQLPERTGYKKLAYFRAGETREGVPRFVLEGYQPPKQTWAA